MSAWNFGGSLLSSLFGFGSNIMTNYFNKKMQDEVNKTNIQIARETNQANRDMTAATNLANRNMVAAQNAAAVAEAEKAYQRSKPTTQVGNMQAAGMSLAGAINSLNGGGSYSPAPVNTARDEASRDSPVQVSPAQMMSAEGVFSNIAQSFMQREQMKSSERMFDKQLAFDREQFEFEKKRKIQNDAYDNIIKTFQAAKLNSEANSANLDYLLKEFTQDDRITAEKQKLIAEKAKALADELQSKLYKGALENVDEETLKALFKYQAMLEMVGNIGNMSLEKAIEIIHDIKEIFIPG